jgi:Ca-activated chloride channel homolog
VPYLDLPHNKDFPSDIEEMKEALARIDSRGGTAMRDAIRISDDHLKKAHRDKKVLVVVTDGVDNASVVSLEALVRIAQQSGVLIYAVGLFTEEDRREAVRAKRELTSLTEATGGEVFFPKGTGRSGANCAGGRAGHPKPVHYCLQPFECGVGWNFPRD